ncbi:Outer spore wall protein 1 [Nakaseomyces bracarensis]|uniref:Outer spore wall protein 1 n=1 Tax=Nakaseomyces bracarensis TaxID=273131 RepID=A0ABR4NVC5_9SACH
MRAPPPPRKSKSRYLAPYFIDLKKTFKIHRIKKFWHRKELFKKQFQNLQQIYQQTYNSTMDIYPFPNDVNVGQPANFTQISPISGIRVEDMCCLSSARNTKSATKKPLLIASFPRGCDRSPRIRVLKKNMWSWLPFCKRKYKLAFYNSEIFDPQLHTKSTEICSHNCANTIQLVKKYAQKEANIKIIYHNPNIISKKMLARDKDLVKTPEFLEFENGYSIRISDFKSLRRRPPGNGQSKYNFTRHSIR